MQFDAKTLFLYAELGMYTFRCTLRPFIEELRKTTAWNNERVSTTYVIWRKKTAEYVNKHSLETYSLTLQSK